MAENKRRHGDQLRRPGLQEAGLRGVVDKLDARADAGEPVVGERAAERRRVEVQRSAAIDERLLVGIDAMRPVAEVVKARAAARVPRAARRALTRPAAS